MSIIYYIQHCFAAYMAYVNLWLIVLLKQFERIKHTVILLIKYIGKFIQSFENYSWNIWSNFRKNFLAVSDLLLSFHVAKQVSVQMLWRQILLPISRCSSGSVALTCELCVLQKCRSEHQYKAENPPPSKQNSQTDPQMYGKHWKLNINHLLHSDGVIF